MLNRLYFDGGALKRSFTSLQFLLEVSMPEEVARKEEHH
jgi:hypothetical protein